MLAQASYDYIKIGLAIRLLRNVTEEDLCIFANTAEADLRERLVDANFAVSLAATESVIYRNMMESLTGAEEGAVLTQVQCDALRQEFSKLENVVFAEALTKKIYVLPDRRFNTEFLLSKPEKLLKEGAFDKLEEIARIDFSSACRCILFGESTAAAFHILRATEAVLKKYYHHHKRQNRLEKPMWGPMVTELKAKQRNKPPAGLLATLDLVRTQYRNPTNHPEAIYQIDSAQDLFGVCLDLIGKMLDEL
jgi:hypothetical protein